LKNFFYFVLLVSSLYSQTIKDISNIVGIRENQLIGYGMVVGARAGGDSKISAQTLQNLLRNSNMNVDIGDAGDAGAVIVTATLPPFARQGDKLKVEVASLDGANLDGARLLVTQLKGVDGKVYALAQGTIIGIEGEPVRGRRSEGSKTGYIYNGAIVENELAFDLREEKSITLSLIKQDAKVAALIEERINKVFGKPLATAYDTRTIEVKKPKDMSIVRFIAKIDDIELGTMMKKKVVIDPVREIIVAGADITINPVTISRENFTLRVQKTDMSDKEWNDPAKNTGTDIGDETALQQVPDEVAPNAQEVVIDNALLDTKELPTVSDLMRAMKTMNLDISQIIDTFQMLDDLGAINADVEIIR
jgi:flagellar P-ring protein FlgI